MRIIIAARLLALAAAAPMLQACLGAGANGPEPPLPLLTSPADSARIDSNAGLSPEEARAQAVAEIRAKAQAHQARHREAPYPKVFGSHGPPLAIAQEQLSESALAAELHRVRRELDSATDPDEAAELAERMAELQALGRSHAQQSEERIRALSERVR